MRKPPFGALLIKQAKTFPRFTVDLRIVAEKIEQKGVIVEAECTIALGPGIVGLFPFL